MENNSKVIKESASAYLQTSSKNKESEYAYQAQQDYNLKGKLRNASTNLDYLKNSLKDIKGTKDDSKSKPLNSPKYDFFSYGRCSNVLDQIGHKNQEINKPQKVASSKDKYFVSNLLDLIKPSKDNANEIKGEKAY